MNHILNRIKQLCYKAAFLTLSMFMCAGLFSYAQAREASAEVHTAKRTARVNFRFDKTVIEPDYMGNTSQFMLLDSIFRYIPAEIIDSIYIFSLASPEGAYKHNIDLAKGREAAFKAFIAKRYPDFPLEKVTSMGGGEAWIQLIEAVDADPRLSHKTKKRVREIATMPGSPYNRKKAMKKLPEYKYILRTIYPKLRYTAVSAWVTDMPEIEKLPEMERINIRMQEALIHPAATIYRKNSDLNPPANTQTREERSYRPPLLALKTNALLYGVCLPQFGYCPIPNASLEYFPYRKKWSVVATFDSPWWKKPVEHKYFQARNYQLEGRWYPWSEDRYKGLFASVYANALLYSIGFGEMDGKQGEGMGAGIGLGYVLPLGQSGRWSLEFSAYAGYLYSGYDLYRWGDPVTGDKDGLYYYEWTGLEEDFVPRLYRYQWLGPTKIGLTLRYDLVRWKKEVAR